MVYTEHAETAAVSRGTSRVASKQRCKYTAWVDIQNSDSFQIACDKSAVNVLESGEQRYNVKSDHHQHVWQWEKYQNVWDRRWLGSHFSNSVEMLRFQFPRERLSSQCCCYLSHWKPQWGTAGTAGTEILLRFPLLRAPAFNNHVPLLGECKALTFKMQVQNQATREFISARKTSHKHNRDPATTATPTWHASKYKVHKLHERYILKEDASTLSKLLPFSLVLACTTWK